MFVLRIYEVIFWIENSEFGSDFLDWKFRIYRVFKKIMAKQILYPLRHAFVLRFLTEWFFA
jgi:hypothetical protein